MLKEADHLDKVKKVRLGEKEFAPLLQHYDVSKHSLYITCLETDVCVGRFEQTEGCLHQAELIGLANAKNHSYSDTII